VRKDAAAAALTACDRIDELDPALHAFVSDAGRRARVTRQAQEAKGGRLAGLPVGIKDVIRVDGLPTRAGSRLPADLFDGPEAPAVTRLRQAGAVVVGKTVTAEFAFLDPGPTRNPRDPAHTPGGSSSGSAAAVASGMVPLALGTQTVGSVIRPAAFCGVVGFKPTYGRIPCSGVIACSPSIDAIGMFVPDVRSAERAASVLCDRWTTFPGAGRPALGVPDGPYLDEVEPPARAEFEATIERLRSCGYEVVCAEAMKDLDDIGARHRRLIAYEMACVHRDWFARHRELYSTHSAAAIEDGCRTTPHEANEALAGGARLRDELEDWMLAHGVDVIVSPSATGPAPKGLSSTGNPVMNLPWSHAGMPAITLPAGTVGKLPLGLQCAGRYGDDERLLAWAAVLERELAG
jgi:Asp-tRNA(Asn)/Glu-tRNA(Gln) amidotransferase A subunit family amidase